MLKSLILLIALCMIFSSCEKNDTHDQPQNPVTTATVVIYTSLYEHKDFLYDFGSHIKDRRLEVYRSYPDCSSKYSTITNVPLHDTLSIIVKNPYDITYWNEIKVRFDSVGCYAIDVQ